MGSGCLLSKCLAVHMCVVPAMMQFQALPLPHLVTMTWAGTFREDSELDTFGDHVFDTPDNKGMCQWHSSNLSGQLQR